MKESAIEAYLVKKAKAAGGEVRKVQWIGRKSAPDRLLMIPPYQWYAGCPASDEFPSQTIWVELKNPDTIKTFPANAHERAQHREHERMRAMGQRVEVIGTIEQVDELFK